MSLAPSFLHPPFRYLCTLIRSPWAFSSPGWTVPALSASPHRRGAPVPSSSLWPFTGHSPLCPCLCCTGEPITGLRTPGVASPVLNSAVHYWRVAECTEENTRHFKNIPKYTLKKNKPKLLTLLCRTPFHHSFTYAFQHMVKNHNQATGRKMLLLRVTAVSWCQFDSVQQPTAAESADQSCITVHLQRTQMITISSL